MNPPAEPARLDYRGLGSLIFLMALVVFVWNGLDAAGWSGGALSRSGFGNLAVMLFLVLSGVFVTEAALRFYRGRPLAFLANRVLRLWPAYLVALALMLAILAASGSAPERAFDPANLLANVAAIFPTVAVTDPLLGVGRRVDLLPIIWTLRVLFAFYLAVAAVLLLGRWARLLPALLAAVMAAHVLLFYGWSPGPRATLYGGFAIQFVLGAAIGLRLCGRLAGGAGFALLAAAAALAFLHALSFRTADASAMGFADPVAPERIWAMATALATLVLAWWASRRPPTPEAASRQRLLASLSLPIYLLHWPALALTLWLWPTPHWSNLLVALALTLLLSVALQALLGPLLAPWRARLRKSNGA